MLQTKKERAKVLSKRLDDYNNSRWRLVQQPQLEELDTQAKIVQLEYNSLHNAMAPISSLPKELIALIFEAGTYLKQKRNHYVAEKRVHFAVLVSHVTRSWRDIALATPRIWTTIRCVKSEVLHRHQELYPERGRHRTAAFLSRSGSLPVDLYIKRFVVDDFQLPLHLLLCHHFRCYRHLSITDVTPQALATRVAAR